MTLAVILSTIGGLTLAVFFGFQLYNAFLSKQEITDDDLPV